MRDNPWLGIRLEDYERHMSHPGVYQLQTMNHMTKAQVDTFMENAPPSATIAILGAAGGNGLEHCARQGIKSVIAVDINPDYLLACERAYARVLPNLQLYCLDLVGDHARAVDILKNADLLIANLLIEHIYLPNFIRILSDAQMHAQMVSCAIQYNPDGETVSQSGYEHVFAGLAPYMQEADAKEIVAAMERIGFMATLSQRFGLPNGKALVRLDFFRGP